MRFCRNQVSYFGTYWAKEQQAGRAGTRSSQRKPSRPSKSSFTYANVELPAHKSSAVLTENECTHWHTVFLLLSSESICAPVKQRPVLWWGRVSLCRRRKEGGRPDQVNVFWCEWSRAARSPLNKPLLTAAATSVTAGFCRREREDAGPESCITKSCITKSCITESCITGVLQHSSPASLNPASLESCILELFSR